MNTTPESEKTKLVSEASSMPQPTPQVFISHDARDAELAEAFGKLLKSVSAGMIKSFRSSDKKAGDGIDFGEEWYRRLMSQLQITSDVVCLFTERSLDRPWLLFEAGVAKGKLNTPVVGVAIGVPLNRVSTGPFYQFQNMESSEADLTKLIHQLAKRIPSLEVDADVVKTQIQVFKAAEGSILKSLATAPTKKAAVESADESLFAKLAEEMKALPSRVAERLSESGALSKRRKTRLPPMVFEEMHMIAESIDDPIGILISANLVRDDLPWLYEIAVEVYRACQSGNIERMKDRLIRLRRMPDMIFRFPLFEEMGGREGHFAAIEFPRLLDRTLQANIDRKMSEASSRTREQNNGLINRQEVK